MKSLQSGAVYVEFLICFTPVFLLFLGVVQLGLLYAGQLLVQHAAIVGVRSAVVVLDDDPALYDGAPRNCLPAEPSPGLGDLLSGGASTSSDSPAMSRSGSDESSLQGLVFASHGDAKTRMATIRSAVQTPLISQGPELLQLVNGQTVRSALGDTSLVGMLSKALYARLATEITFPAAPGSARLRRRFERRGPVTLRVRYLFSCRVPLASLLLCKATPSFDDDNAADRGIAAFERLTASTVALGARFSRFRVLSAEATLPNQGADYRYPSEGKTATECPDES